MPDFDWRKIPTFPDPSLDDYYADMIGRAPNGAKIVEVGNYFGRGLCCLGNLVRSKKGSSIRIYGVDHGEGMSSDTTYSTMLKNLEMAGIKDIVTPILKKSVDAAKMFKDEELWCVFLDGSHDRFDVAADIDAWMPKICQGGIIAGHDYRWHTVCESVNAKLDDVIHNVKWDNVWEAPKQVPHNNSRIHEKTTIPQTPREMKISQNKR